MNLIFTFEYLKCRETQTAELKLLLTQTANMKNKYRFLSFHVFTVSLLPGCVFAMSAGEV